MIFAGLVKTKNDRGCLLPLSYLQCSSIFALTNEFPYWNNGTGGVSDNSRHNSSRSSSASMTVVHLSVYAANMKLDTPSLFVLK